MDLVVQKYGGTSVANTKKIKNIARNIQKLRKRKKSLVVVVSAMAGETDKLHNLTKDISKMYLIGLFLAILELIKTDKITFKQVKNFSDIKILRAS